MDLIAVIIIGVIVAATGVMNPKAKKKIYPGMKLIIRDELIKEQKKTKKEDNKDVNYVDLKIQLITQEGKKIVNEPIYFRSINESGTITKTKNYKSYTKQIKNT